MQLGIRPSIAILVLISLPASPFASHGRWKLIWHDEFNSAKGSSPDARKWTYDLGAGGWGNQELERYTDSAENVQYDGRGHLVIRATQDASGSIESARLKTQGRFSTTYGRVAARMKLPRGQGVWPAFWMLGTDLQQAGWPECGEIDIMENVGKEPAVVHGTLHGPGYSGAHAITRQTALANNAAFADDYHVYAVEWSPQQIAFLVDNRQYAALQPSMLPEHARWVYDHPFFLLLNLAIGGAWPGNPDQTTVFPQELSIDWVRVWSANPEKH